MRAFVVEAGTEVKMIGYEKGYADVLGPFSRPVDYTTREEAMFFLEDMIIDPTGILRDACGPKDKVIGGAYAKAGYYGFRLDSKKFYAVMVPATAVTVG